MSAVKKIQFDHFVWIDISGPTKHDIEQLGEEFKFHPLDLADCLTISQRSKIDIYQDYLFLVLLYPIYNYETREILPTELDVFVSKNYIITVHSGDLQVVNDFGDLFQVSATMREKYIDGSPERLLYELLNKLYLYIFPMIDHLGDDCDNIEKAIFSGREKKMISEILIIRRNITDFRKISAVHKNVIKKAVNNLKDSPMFMMKKTDVYFESLIDHTKEIWDTLENQKERIEALQQSNESQISFKTSDIMRMLTLISVVTFPVTLLATVFGMNTVISMPFVNDQHGFWYVVSIMIAMIFGMIIYFRHKGWL